MRPCLCTDLIASYLHSEEVAMWRLMTILPDQFVLILATLDFFSAISDNNSTRHPCPGACSSRVNLQLIESGQVAAACRERIRRHSTFGCPKVSQLVKHILLLTQLQLDSQQSLNMDVEVWIRRVSDYVITNTVLTSFSCDDHGQLGNRRS